MWLYSLPRARMNAVGHWNIAPPLGYTVCFHCESTLNHVNCLLHKLITWFVLVFKNNAEQTLWTVVRGRVLDSVASSSARWTLRFASFRNNSVQDWFSAFILNRKSTTWAWYRVFIDSRPIQTPHVCLSNPECFTSSVKFSRHWNILGFSGHFIKIGAHPSWFTLSPVE